jgi:hypothetical protein
MLQRHPREGGDPRQLAIKRQPSPPQPAAATSAPR